MPQFTYRGRDKDGNLRAGIRFSATVDNLNAELAHEGIFPLQIIVAGTRTSFWDTLQDWLQDKNLQREELAIFSRQMKLLQQAGVPLVIAFKQLAEHTRSRRLAHSLQGLIEHLEKGQNLATAMQQYPTVFSPLMVNLIRIGESTGHLSEAFEHIHQYLTFDTNNAKQIKEAFRYPLFVSISMIIAIIVINIFVIPTFGHFYSNTGMSLPWQTKLLIGSSYVMVHYGFYLLGALSAGIFWFMRYINTPNGRYQWDKLILKLPIIGKLSRRIILIRITQSLAIVIGSGLQITQAIQLVREIVQNAYIARQLTQLSVAIERGTSFTQAITTVDLFTPLESQILAVGEKNGELSPALSYIASFHAHEITFDLKRMGDLIGPLLIGIVSGLILIIALGVYLPIWNMVNLPH